VALALAVFVVGAIVIAAATSGLAAPSVPSGDVAYVQDVPGSMIPTGICPGGRISQADFDTALGQVAKAQGLKSAPKPGSPEYDTLKQSAMANLILACWIKGEAHERGIAASQAQVRVKEQQFRSQNGLKSDQAFARAMAAQGLTVAQARDQLALSVLGDAIQNQVLPPGQTPSVSDDEVLCYYEAHISQFRQPETRDVRLILNKDEAKVEAAKQALGPSPTPADWKRVAKRYSTDAATKDSGGLRKGVAQGQTEPTLERQIFSASTGQIVGPFKSETGYYLIQVEAVHPATTQPLTTSLENQIRQQLQQTKQQQIASGFEQDFIDKWTTRTFCDPDYLMDRCSGYVAPPACTKETAEKTGCPAPVPSTKPIAPGEACGTPSGLPQGPISSPSASPATAPIPLGPPGAPPPGG